MNFGFTEEQELLRASARQLLDERCPLEEVRRTSETPSGYDEGLWKEIAELGWPSLLVPEAQGGAGLGFVDLVVLLEEAGRSLFPSPLVSTMLAVLALRDNASELQRSRWLPDIASGDALFSVALQEASGRLDAESIATQGRDAGSAGLELHGEKHFVVDAPVASHFVVAVRTGGGPEELALAVVEAGASGVEVVPQPVIDSTQRLGKLVLRGATVAPDDVMAIGTAAFERACDQAAAAVTAEAIGAAEAAIALTCDYARARRQFGSPIGRFQGVKHPLAEMYVDVESWKSLLYWAAWCLDERPDEAPRHVSMAKALASDAFTRIGLDVVQLHGALGYTWEYDAQLFLKRSKWVKSMFGGSDHHYSRVARLGGW